MKKEEYYKSMCLVSIFLAILFVVFVLIDYFKYDAVFTSAPFYVNILMRAMEFLLPSIVAFIVSLIYKNKFSK